jgi:hypothetical protein
MKGTGKDEEESGPVRSKCYFRILHRGRGRKPLKILPSGRNLNRDPSNTKQESSPFSAKVMMRGIIPPPPHTNLLRDT